MSLCHLSFSKLIIILSLLIINHISSGANAAAVNTSLFRHRYLTVDYYSKTCPHLEQIVSSVVSQKFKVSPATAPATIRLFFHDCFVQGCDGSVLLSSKPGSKELAEKDAQDNKEIPAEAYDIIESAKGMVESKCPGVVSCADILALVTREYIHLGCLRVTFAFSQQTRLKEREGVGFPKHIGEGPLSEKSLNMFVVRVKIR
ncbi:unnamed protein product [Lactuca saligna]|uniref:peroxidase n=1 Tax=Lactuca saligna TaxID=75948 RepID=A0AA35YCH6_LACSI|nr:unnamed protein product [Lactuca saligna]